MTEQQKLQNAKDAVAKENGYESFDELFQKLCITQHEINQVAIKYQQLCEAEYIECLTELRNTYLYGIDDNGDVKASMSEIITLWNRVKELLPQPPK